MAKILIVEDDPLIRQALSDLLIQADYQVLQAVDGQVGLHDALQEHPDLILLDYFMPMKSGLDFLHELRQDIWGKMARVIFLTNNADIAVINAALQDDITDYLIKSDMSGAALLAAVSQKLETT